MAWTLKQYQNAWGLIPELSADDVSKALPRTGKALPADREQAFQEGLAVALHAYVADKLREVGAQDVKRSATAKNLDRIAKQAERLRKLVPEDGNHVSTAASRELRRMLLRTPWLRQTVVLPPTDSEGFAALQAASKVIALLAEAAKSAYGRERALIERERKRKGKARHEGDTAMRTLIRNINGVWSDAFDELPADTMNADKGYVPFLHALLDAYTARVPDELQRLAPLRTRLKLSQEAIRAHFRATRISKLRRMAKSISK